MKLCQIVILAHFEIINKFLFLINSLSNEAFYFEFYFFYAIALCNGQELNNTLEKNINRISFQFNYYSNPVGGEIKIQNFRHENLKVGVYKNSKNGSNVINLTSLPQGQYKFILTYEKFEGEEVRNSSGQEFEFMSYYNVILNTFITFDYLGNVNENFCSDGQNLYLLANPNKIIVFFEIK